MKYKDPGSPTILVNIGGTFIEKTLLDLGDQCQFVVLLGLQAVRAGRIEAHYHHLVFGGHINKNSKRDSRRCFGEGG